MITYPENVNVIIDYTIFNAKWFILFDILKYGPISRNSGLIVYYYVNKKPESSFDF